MPIQLTTEQEQRIQAVVEAGAYPSAEEALDAAVAAVEIVAAPGFQGDHEELEVLIAEGLNSGEPIEATGAFWDHLKAETDQMAVDYGARNPRT